MRYGRFALFLTEGEKLMALNKYAKDYRLENQVNKKGKTVTKAVYVGDHFKFEKSEAEVKKATRIITVCAVVCLFSLILGIAFYRNIGFSSQYYTLIPFACCFLPILYLNLAAYNLLTAKEKVKRETKDAMHDRVAKCGIGIMILDGWNLTGIVLAFILKLIGTVQKPFVFNDVVFIVASVMMMAGALIAFLQRKSIKMVQI